jgi:hypothetical protein
VSIFRPLPLKIYQVNYKILSFLFFCLSANAQLFSESFSYPEKTNLTSVGWTEHSGGGTNPISISEGLIFGGANLNGGVSLSGGGQDVNRSFDAQNSLPVYASFLVNVKSASNDGEYFLHLGPQSIGTNFRGKVFVKSSSDGIQFGISKSSNSAIFSDRIYQLNTSYQVVLKYSFNNTSSTDDVAELFVLETPSLNEPENRLKATEGESDSPDIGSIALRQGSSSKAPTLIIDEIKVANSWKEAVTLKREESIQIMFPEKVYAFSSNCEKEAIFDLTLNAFWPTDVINVWSPDGDILQFSKDRIIWSNQLTFKTDKPYFYESFYVKMLNSKLNVDLGELSINTDDSKGKAISQELKKYEVFKLRNDCTLPIKETKLLQMADTVLVAGRITASANEFPKFNYLQDNTSGVRIEGDFGFEIGDSVRFNGVLSILNQEIVLLEDTLKGFKVFDNKAIQPLEVKLEDLLAHGGEYVQVSGVELQDKNFVFMPNSNETVQVGNRVSPLRVWSKTEIDGHLKPQGKFNVSGVVGQYRDQFQIYPRLKSDIDQLGQIPISKLNISKEYTFDVAAWNLEWFGSSGNGPADNELQLQNALKVMIEIDADVFVLEEITDLNTFSSLVSYLDGYSGGCSPAVSGGGEPDQAQRVCFVFKDKTVTPVRISPLLKGTLPIAVYPETFERFWASGRLPALLECDVKVDGVERRMHIIGIHARANRNTPEERELVYNMRMKDIEVLKDSLDFYYPNASIIMAGDFNDDVDETVVSGLKESTYSVFVNDAENWKALTKELSDARQKSYIGYDNVIDHVIVSNELFGSAIPMGTELLLPFLNIEEYAETTSDHLPVLSRFMLKSVLTANELTEIDSVIIYPNPTQGNLKIEIPDEQKAVVKLLNIKGELIEVVDGRQKQIERKIAKILTKQSAGLYLLKVLIGNTSKTFKIVKE